jgi:hypothetical protein
MRLTRRDVEAKIVALARQDDDFRRKFVHDGDRARSAAAAAARVPHDLSQRGPH